MTLATPPHLLVAVTLNMTAVPLVEVASAVIARGHSSARQHSSETMTGKEDRATLPLVSVAEHETVVVPAGKKLPLGGVHTKVGRRSQTSLAVTVKLTIVPAALEQFVRTSLGTCNRGAMESETVTLNAQRLVLPLPSCAAHVTVVTPIGNTLPEDGVHCTLALPPQTFVATTSKRTTVPAAGPHST